jgi:hypothetical protein
MANKYDRAIFLVKSVKYISVVAWRTHLIVAPPLPRDVSKEICRVAKNAILTREILQVRDGGVISPLIEYQNRL